MRSLSRFLGPAYDPVLREVYTQVSPEDIVEHRTLLSALFDDAMADNKPLMNLIRKHVDQKMLDAVAAEYAKGRLLLKDFDTGYMRSLYDVGYQLAAQHYLWMKTPPAAIPTSAPHQ